MKEPIRHPERESPRSGIWTATAAVAIAVVGITASFMLPVLELSSLPAGTRIRPILLATKLYVIAFTVQILALALGIAAIVQLRRTKRMWLIGLIGIALSFAPLSVARATTKWIVEQHQLILAD